MKRQITFLMTALVALMMVSTSCEPTLEQGGRQVKFTVRSNGATSTKTFYKDEPTGNGTVRISWSDNDYITIFSPSTGAIQGTEASLQDSDYDLPLKLAHYGLTNINNGAEGQRSTAELVLAEENPNGLTWIGQGSATFYGIYPRIQGKSGYNTYGQGLSFVLTIPEVQDGKADETVVSKMPLVAKTADVANGGKVQLEFKPAFSAFEFHLKSGDGDLTLHSFTLSQDNETMPDNTTPRESDNKRYLTGTCYYNMDNQLIHYVTGTPAVQGEVACQDALTISLGDKVVNANTEAVFTLFALPNDLDKLTIAVNFTKAGVTKTRKLKLQKADKSWVNFPATHKARITGLALDGGDSWKITIKTLVNEWTYYEEQMSSFDQINVAPIAPPDLATVKVTGGIETTASWKAANGNSSNHERPNDVPSTDPSYYSRYYQIRTLNWALPTNKQFFEISFTPTAPYGGYWMMTAEPVGNYSVSDHFRFEVVTNGVNTWEAPETELKGQIMNRKVFIRIYPLNYGPEDINIYEMTLKSYFSPNNRFDPSYSADSELQDVHGNGQFSYWCFRLEKYAGTYPPADPEHESDAQ